MENPPFGWFVQLDSVSQKKIAELFDNLSEEEKAFFGDIDLQCVRLMADKFAVREWAHDHCETQVTLEGEISEPDLFGEFSSFKFNPEEVTPAITEKEKALACLALDGNTWDSSSLNWTEEDLSDGADRELRYRLALQPCKPNCDGARIFVACAYWPPPYSHYDGY